VRRASLSGSVPDKLTSSFSPFQVLLRPRRASKTKRHFLRRMCRLVCTFDPFPCSLTLLRSSLSTGYCRRPSFRLHDSLQWSSRAAPRSSQLCRHRPRYLDVRSWPSVRPRRIRIAKGCRRRTLLPQALLEDMHQLETERRSLLRRLLESGGRIVLPVPDHRDDGEAGSGGRPVESGQDRTRDGDLDATRRHERGEGARVRAGRRCCDWRQSQGDQLAASGSKVLNGTLFHFLLDASRKGTDSLHLPLHSHSLCHTLPCRPSVANILSPLAIPAFDLSSRHSVSVLFCRAKQ
jgi:hypothetical protein